MKLALLVEYYPPSRTSAAIQMADLARAFGRQGHEVTVFSTSPELAQPCVRQEGTGLTVVRVPTGKSKGIGLVRRALNEIFMSFALWRGTSHCSVCVRDFDGIIWYSPTIFLAPFVAWLKYQGRARAYLILRDIFPQWTVDAGVMRRGLAFYFFKMFELFQYRVADVIGVQSPANLDYFDSGARSRRHFEVLFNWMELDRPQIAPTDLLQRHGIAGKRVVVYGGNMGIAQDVDNLVRLGESLREAHEVVLLLIGAGTEVTRLRHMLSERLLTNVVLVDEVEPDEFRSILTQCHVGLITLDRRLTTHNIPGKLLTYLEAGLPVVASINPGNDLLRILHESAAGIGFINGQDSEFAKATLKLVLDPSRCAIMSQKARALARERFSVESVTRQLASALSRKTELIARSPA